MTFAKVHIDGAGSIADAILRDDIRDEIRSFRGRDVDITIEAHRAAPRKRSLDQNAYWWGVPVKVLAEHCGYTANQMHYALLGECFGYTAGPTGQPVPVVASSSQLSTAQFKDLIDWVLTWAAAELGVVIPAPNEKERAA